MLNKKNQQGKNLIGYTVTSYQNVLEALQAQKVITVERITNVEATPEMNYVRRNYTILNTETLDTNVIENNGFLFGGDNSPLYQAICVIDNYMSFPALYRTDNQGQKNSYVQVDKGKGISNGRTEKSGITYPPVNLSQNIERLKQSGDKCYVGVGISTSELAIQFFKTYFPDMSSVLTQAKLQRIISLGNLYAQILVPQRKTSAKVLHAKVTLTVGTGTSNGPYVIYVPTPILLLKDFESIGSVVVDAGDNKGEVKVGKDKVTFPLSGSRYYHKTGELYGLTPNMLQNYIKQDNSHKVTYKRTTLCSQGVQAQARVRLYFDQAAKSELGAIPQQYQKQLFTGAKSQADVTRVETVAVGAGNYNGRGGYMLDIGHSSLQGGTKAYNGKREYEYNKQMATAVAGKLTAANIPVNLIDYPIKNDAEFKKINAQFKRDYKDYFALVSFHNNDYDGKRHENQGGSMVLTDARERHELTDVLGYELAEAMATIMTGSRCWKNKLFRRNLGLLGGITQRPAVLLETGFLNHVKDVEKLENPETFDKLATVIANVLINFYNKHKNSLM